MQGYVHIDLTASGRGGHSSYPHASHELVRQAPHALCISLQACALRPCCPAHLRQAGTQHPCCPACPATSCHTAHLLPCAFSATGQCAAPPALHVKAWAGALSPCRSTRPPSGCPGRLYEAARARRLSSAWPRCSGGCTRACRRCSWCRRCRSCCTSWPGGPRWGRCAGCCRTATSGELCPPCSGPRTPAGHSSVRQQSACQTSEAPTWALCSP